MTHGFEGVVSIDVQEIDGSIFEMWQSLIECAAHKSRNAGVVIGIVCIYSSENFIAVKTSMFITLPCIHRKACSGQAKAIHGLAKGKVGVSVVGSQLHEGRWRKSLNNPESKGNMADPSREFRLEIIWLPKHGR